MPTSATSPSSASAGPAVGSTRKRAGLRRILIAALLAVSLATVACGGDDGDREPGNRLLVVTTVSPITSLVENIGGTRIDLHGLIPEGVNSHTYEPPASEFRVIADADLIILNALGLEERTLELAEANKKDGAVILALGDEVITPEEYKFDSSFPESGGKPNPHVWPNPAHTMDYVTAIHDKLVELDGANEDYYDANSSELTARLELLDQQMRVAAQTVPVENRRLLTYHDSWAYWAERYGFEVVGAIQPSDLSEPSVRDIADLVEQIKQQDLPAFFGSEVFPTGVLETIAAESGANYVGALLDDDLPGEPGDPEHTYLGLMVQNMRIMIPALGGDATPMDRVQTGLVFADGPGTADYPP